ncbi:hypothetical protein KY290_033745 [Solanum tuberosum]|uniref:Transposase MuDR plant domain-containing protein n=1 Tax=Solanum tuberosum TaxID=4113 RepID=A0ABQ7U343_SOLTU|nr:hypothetical protein KY289_033117 [Solanum tuberosum]KAH0647755.1 hypothetical protein KY285_033003 [Solanum tuberosum]KAH0740702.1 hypothetical protein KY290_033745 [Solanum tuberosum]
MSGYEANNVRFVDVCEEFEKNLGFTKVNQLLVTGPSRRYYLVTNDDGMRTLQYLFSKKFRVINFFAVNSFDLSVFAQNITYHTETYIVDDDVASDQESSSSEFDESDSNDYNEEELEVFSHEKRRDVTDTLENYKVLEKGQAFKDISEARRIICFYAMANRYGLRVKKTDTTRVGANANTLAHLFKRKVQYNPQLKVKRAKRLALEKLEGSFLDDYNKLEAYGQELRTSNPGSDVVINISKEALLQGKRKFLRMYICFKALKDGWKSGLRPLIGLDDGHGMTFISDMQKGLIDAKKSVFPEAKYKYCVRHIEANWCKKKRSGQSKKLM